MRCTSPKFVVLQHKLLYVLRATEVEISAARCACVFSEGFCCRMSDNSAFSAFCLQCLYAVGWAAGTASGL